jgi:hypothetical protein
MPQKLKTYSRTKSKSGLDDGQTCTLSFEPPLWTPLPIVIVKKDRLYSLYHFHPMGEERVVHELGMAVVHGILLVVRNLPSHPLELEKFARLSQSIPVDLRSGTVDLDQNVFGIDDNRRI